MNNGQSLAQRIAQPGKFEKDFIGYLQANDLVVSQSKTIAPVSYYQALSVASASGIVSFFTGTPVQANTNLSDFVRPVAEHAVITGIRIFEGVNATIASTDWVAGANDAGVKNSDITITVNGVKVLDKYPTVDALEGLTTGAVGYIPLAEPIIWAGSTSISIQVDFKGASPAANTNLRFELSGVGLIS